MSRRIWVPLTLLAALLAVVLLLPVGGVISDTLEQVLIANFPEIQTVDGTVKVDFEGPVRYSELVPFKGIVVPPVEPTDTTDLVSAGTLKTDGFTHAVLSIHGLVQGSVQKPGVVGAMLLPKEEGILLAFKEQGLVHFSLDVSTEKVGPKTPYFASRQPRRVIGFPEYEILLYNTTDKTVRVDFFAYLTN